MRYFGFVFSLSQNEMVSRVRKILPLVSTDTVLVMGADGFPPSAASVTSDS
jgi:hypothetical protein